MSVPAPDPRAEAMDKLSKTIGGLIDKIPPDQIADAAASLEAIKKFDRKLDTLQADVTQLGANILVLNRKLNEIRDKLK